MAIKIETEFPGKSDGASADYPYGSARDITTPGDGLGTPWIKAIPNDIYGFLQSLLKAAGVIPDGVVEKFGASQYLQSLIAIVSGKLSIYTDSGTADNIVLDPPTDSQIPDAYFNGFAVKFSPAFDITGAADIRVGTLPIVNLFDENGNELLSGDCITTEEYKIIHDGVNFRLYHSGRYKRQKGFVSRALISGAAIAWDLDIAQVAELTLATNGTLSAPTNIKNGNTYILVVTQDATGGRTLAYNAVYKWPAGVAPTLSTTANAIDVLSFVASGGVLLGAINQDFG